jgi:uncharacterized protein (DUF2267 family)
VTVPKTDEVTAYLDEVREHLHSGECARCEATPPLLKAVEAVRKLADSWDRSAAELDEMAARAAERGAAEFRTEAMATRAKTRRDCAQALREAISRALLAEEQSND